jgi:hypothetical protein
MFEVVQRQGWKAQMAIIGRAMAEEEKVLLLSRTGRRVMTGD